MSAIRNSELGIWNLELWNEFQIQNSKFLIRRHLVHSALRVGARRRSLHHPARHRGHVSLMDGAAADVVRVFGVAREAMLAALPVDDLGFGRGHGAREKFLHL